MSHLIPPELSISYPRIIRLDTPFYRLSSLSPPAIKMVSEASVHA